MLTIRKSDTRGRSGADWLDSRHSFSFADYYDPDRMGFGPLRVINEDRIAPGRGFPMHGHRDMEIVTYMTAGALRHEDTLGNAGVIRAGDVQRMTAGTGIRHSEMNASDSEEAKLLQIWIVPDRGGHAPGYDQKHFAEADKSGRLALLVSGTGRDGSLRINRDADIHAALLKPGDSVTHRLATDRKAWVQVVAGSVTVNGEGLNAGDAMAIEDAGTITVSAAEDAELLLFDMA
jgi:redox-sensitive bicupin YhaK (pirin superfamily)